MASLSLFTFMHWGRQRHPTPVFLPGDFHGRWAAVHGAAQSWARRSGLPPSLPFCMSVPYCLPVCGSVYGLKLVSINPPALFIIFKTVSGILGCMYFHKYFKIGLLVSKTSWNFNCNYLEFLDQSVENCYHNSEFPNLSFI